MYQKDVQLHDLSFQTLLIQINFDKHYSFIFLFDFSLVHLYTFYFYKKVSVVHFQSMKCLFHGYRQSLRNSVCVRWELISAEVILLQFIRVRLSFIKFGLKRFCNHYSILRDPWLVSKPLVHGDGEQKEIKQTTFTTQTRTSYSEKILERPCKRKCKIY